MKFFLLSICLLILFFFIKAPNINAGSSAYLKMLWPLVSFNMNSAQYAVLSYSINPLQQKTPYINSYRQAEVAPLYDGKDIFITKAYPNPVSNVTSIDYHLFNDQSEAKLVMHNVLGSKVAEFKLSHLESKLTISTKNLSPGVYFYTLYLNNENIVTHKLIVKRQ